MLLMESLLLLYNQPLKNYPKPWYKIRYLNVFRDEASLTAAPHLWTNIQAALAQSEYLIYMASPTSASSKWIKKEIEYWFRVKSINTLLIVLTDGEISWDDETQDFLNKETNSLPDILENKIFTEEPFYIDLRTARTQEDVSLNNPIFKKEVLKLAAHLHGKQPKDLASEEVFAHRKMIRARNGAITILAFLLCIAVAAAWLANKNAKEATKQSKNALARQLAAQAELIKNNKNPSLIEESVLFTLNQYKLTILRLDDVFRKSLAVLPRPILKLSHKEWVHDMFVSIKSIPLQQPALIKLRSSGILKLVKKFSVSHTRAQSILLHWTQS